MMALKHTRKTIPVSKISPDPENPNTMTDKQMQAMRESIESYGNAQDLWVRPTKNGYTIIDGEHRYVTAKDMGHRTITARVFEADAKEARVMRQVANKLHGRHDPKRDAEEIKRIHEAGQLQSLADKTAQDVRALKHSVSMEENPLVQSEINTAPKRAKAYQTWQLGRHVLHCNDATTIDWGQADLLLTDPPYGINVVKEQVLINESHRPKLGKRGRYKDVKGDKEQFDPTWLLGISAKNKIIWGGNHFADKLPVGHRWFIWDKTHGADDGIGTQNTPELAWSNLPQKSNQMLRVLWKGAIRVENNKANPRVHPTQKPVQLYEKLMLAYSPDEGIILDPYAGSGPCILAAERTGRTCIAAEIDPHYCDHIIARWEKQTGQKAKKVG